jgi:hypothetical protein
MKTKTLLVLLLLLSIAISSCSVLSNAGVKVITPSNTIISENRDVSGFHAIDFSTVGKINILQGNTESLNISGPDNLVPEITTSVNSGTLVIKNRENITVTSLSTKDILTFTIVVKDLTSLDVSGLGDVQVDALNTSGMTLSMSGAGKVQMNQLTADTLNINLSGLGGLDLTGTVPQATIDLSGAGSITASDLQLKTASITISGLGGATLWVTDQLNGTISGAGSVSYYGSPSTNTNSTGLGQFKSLGNK